MSLLESMHATPHIPSIVVTPVLSSRNSLPVDMRSALDSILGVVSSPTSECGSDLDSNAAVVGVASDLSTEDVLDDDDAEVPHSPSTPQPAAAENTFLLNLDYETTRFSIGDVLSVLDATPRHLSSDTDSAVEDGLVVDVDTSRLSPASRSSESFVVVTDEMSRPEPGTGDQRLEGQAELDGSSGSIRRAAPIVGKCPPSWRHAMYVSSLVWPAQRSQRGGDSVSPGDRSPKLRWCGVDLLARALGIKRG